MTKERRNRFAWGNESFAALRKVERRGALWVVVDLEGNVKSEHSEKADALKALNA